MRLNHLLAILTCLVFLLSLITVGERGYYAHEWEKAAFHITQFEPQTVYFLELEESDISQFQSYFKCTDTLCAHFAAGYKPNSTSVPQFWLFSELGVQEFPDYVLDDIAHFHGFTLGHYTAKAALNLRNGAILSAPHAQPGNFSFIVAGHAYGSRKEDNLGIHPPFLAALEFEKERRNFFVFTGDLTRSSTEESWETISTELNTLGLPYFVTLGSHDVYTPHGENYLVDEYGSTYYRFDIGKNRFIFLNSQAPVRSISPDQISFLYTSLKDENISTAFIFFNDLLWTEDVKYKDLLPNKGSRHYNMRYSNYWETIHPLFEKFPEKKFYVIAGDVAATPDGIAAYYEPLGNITFIASGMGDLQDSNYLIVSVVNEDVRLSLHSVNDPLNTFPLENYTLDHLTSSAFFTRVHLLLLRIQDFIQEFTR